MRARLFPAVLALGAVAAQPLCAEPFANAEWRLRQEVGVTQPGRVKVALPEETLDAARPDLGDLRLVDPSGAEIAFAIERSAPASSRLLAPESQSGSVEDNATVFILKTGIDDRIAGLEIDAGQQSFLTRATVEAGDDGRAWRVLGRNLPLYDRGRQLRALELKFPAGVYPYLRLTLDRLDGRHIALRRISLLAQSGETDETAACAVRIATREETPGETRLTLALPGANLALAALEITTPDPVFHRSVRLVYRAFEGDAIREITLVQRTLARAAPVDPTDPAPLSLAVEQPVPTRELILVVDNGDSPPLGLTSVSARRRPVFVVFYAAAAGPHRLYLGNAKATAPRYDVGTLVEASRTVAPLRLATEAVGPNPEYHPSEPLPEIPALGAPLDIAAWGWRKPVQIGGAGVQQLELDPAVLARAQRDFSDLRLISRGRQVPFVVERTSLVRPLAVSAVLEPDPKQPRLSRWQIALPLPRLALTRLTATVSTPLFQRQLQLHEDLEDDRGYVSRRWLGDASWSQTPARRAASFALTLSQAPETDRLWLETDNGDNPPILLRDVHVYYPVTRLLFKSADDAPVFLYYGAAAATAPRYDLSLVGAQLLAADKAVPALGAEEALQKPTLAQAMTTGGRGGILFWTMLGLVVLVLLAAIARLLPKAPPGANP